MQRRWLSPGLLLVLPVTAALWAEYYGIVQAIEECRLEPGWEAPPGSKWLSRINRDHHRCWFLSSRAIGGPDTQVRRAAPAKNRHLASDTDAVRRREQRYNDLPTASAPKDKTDIGVTAEPPGGRQVAPPSVDQSSKNLFPHSVPTIAYSLPPPSAQMVSRPTAVAAAHHGADTGSGERIEYGSSCWGSSRAVICWRSFSLRASWPQRNQVHGRLTGVPIS